MIETNNVVELSASEKFLLDWLSKEDWSSYGECYGKDFDRLSALGFVERKPSNRSREHEYFDLCRLTEAGRASLTQGGKNGGNSLSQTHLNGTKEA